ncbi:hypothetical protein Hanom_Chr07g00598931 [Helianthus anomalus]
MKNRNLYTSNRNIGVGGCTPGHSQYFATVEENLKKSNVSGKDGPNEINVGEYKSGPGNDLFSDGPTPFLNLGKRNRDDQSPPSIGSIQGPTQCLFYQPNNSEYVPLDLNTPVRVNSIKREDEADEYVT